VRVKYFADRNPPVDPSATRTSRRPSRCSAVSGVSTLRRVDGKRPTNSITEKNQFFQNDNHFLEKRN